MGAAANPVLGVFRQYTHLYRMRNTAGGNLAPEYQSAWAQVSLTLENIFAGDYEPEPGYGPIAPLNETELREAVPLEFLRVPARVDVLCETSHSFFSGRLKDISTGGAYVNASVPLVPKSKIRLTFPRFVEEKPLELDALVAWNNLGGMRKRAYPEGAGLEFLETETSQRSLQNYVYDVLESSLSRAHLM